MINWWHFAFNAAWIVGASIIAAASSYLFWLAREAPFPFRQAFHEPSWRVPFGVGFMLIGIGWVGVASTVSESVGPTPRLASQLEFPRGVAVDAAGNVYISDTTHNRVQRVAASGVTTTVAGNGRWGYSGDGGPAPEASLYGPWGLAVDGTGNLYIADYVNDRIRKVETTTGTITTVAGGGNENGDGGPATAAHLSAPYAVALDGAGNLYIADADIQRIRRVSAASGVITTVLVGGDDGLGDEARQLDVPTGVAADAEGNLYIADHWRHRIRKVSAATGAMTIVAGSGPMGKGNGDSAGDGQPATRARLNSPMGVAVDKVGNLYIADADNLIIRMVSAAGVLTSVAGRGREEADGGLAINAAVKFPVGLTVDPAGDLYILEVTGPRVRKVSLTTSIITTVAR